MINTQAIGLAGYCHLIFYCLVLPWAAIRSAGKMALSPYPPRLKFYRAVLIQHLCFFVVSAAVALVEIIPLTKKPRWPALSFVVTAIILIVMVALMMPQWKRNVAERERRAYLFMPRGASEKTLWVLISIAAGIGEEIAYRGVMWELFARLTGSLSISALIASAVFALSHYIQGWTSIFAIFGFALGFHVLVWITDSLFPAMFLHASYDLVAGMVYSHFGVKLDYPPEGIPPPRGNLVREWEV